MNEATKKFGERFFHIGELDEAFKNVRKKDYLTESAYIDAVTEYHLQHSSPEYNKAYNTVKAEYERRKNENQEINRTERYTELRGSTKLESWESAKIDEEARKLADNDIANGRIGASGYAKAVKSHAEKLSKEAKENKAASSLMNDIFRGKI